jgi:hypothetical protein
MLTEQLFPQSVKERCEHCAIAGAVYDFNCLGCEVRHTSMLPKFWRMEIYHRAKAQVNEAFARVFVSHVNAARKRAE